MSRNNRNTLWIAAASAAPLAHWSGIGWMAAVLAVVAAVPLCWLPGERRNNDRIQSAVQSLWAAMVLGSLLPAAGHYWNGGGKAVGLILLTLAALSGNADSRERAGNTLFWLLTPVWGLILIPASDKLQWSWLTPAPGKWSGELLCLLLLPALAHSKDGKRTPGILPAVSGGIAIAAALLIQGCLSHGAAAATQIPLYETGRVLGPGGEILVSVGASLSWYAFASLLFGRAQEAAAEVTEKSRLSGGILWCISGGMILLELPIPGAVLALGSLILWVFVPFLTARKNN